MARRRKTPEQPPTNYERAQKLADDLLTQPLTDTEALKLAGVYASLAQIDALAAADIYADRDEDILTNGEPA